MRKEKKNSNFLKKKKERIIYLVVFIFSYPPAFSSLQVRRPLSHEVALVRVNTDFHVTESSEYFCHLSAAFATVDCSLLLEILFPWFPHYSILLVFFQPVCSCMFCYNSSSFTQLLTREVSQGSVLNPVLTPSSFCNWQRIARAFITFPMPLLSLPYDSLTSASSSDPRFLSHRPVHPATF